MENPLNLVTHLLKIPNASLDADHLFLCPLFAIIFDAAGLRFLFDEEVLDGMNEIYEDQWEESVLEYPSIQMCWGAI